MRGNIPGEYRVGTMCHVQGVTLENNISMGNIGIAAGLILASFTSFLHPIWP